MNQILEFNRTYGVITILLLVATWSFSQVVEAALEERVETTPVIFEGEVVSRRSYWNVDHSYIYTVNRIKVNQVLKGGVTNKEVELLTYGGTVYPDKIVVHPSLTVAVGEFGLFFVRPVHKALDRTTTVIRPQYEGAYSTSSVVRYNIEEGVALDAFKVYGDIFMQFYPRLKELGLHPKRNRIKKYLAHLTEERGVLAVSITSFSPTTTTAGTFSVLTINGSGFGNTRGSGSVAFSNADNGGASISVLPLSTGYVSWSDTQIEVEVPTRAGTGAFRVTNTAGEQATSGSNLTIRYNLSNVNYNNRHRRTNLVNSDNSGGYELVFQTDFNNNSNAKNAYIRALDTWRCSSGTQVYFDDGGATPTDVAALDGENVIRFDNGGELPLNVLGRSTSYWTGCNGGNDWFLSETDIVFDDGTNWNYDPGSGTTAGNEIDFESVALHETGHSHQLGHVINSNDVMHYSIGGGIERRSLNSDDLDGGNDVVNWSQGVCGKLSMDVYSCQAMSLEDIGLYVASQEAGYAVFAWELYLSEPIERFVLERSADRNQFDPIGEIVKKGDGLSYTYIDRAPIRGWYRVRAEIEDRPPVYSNIVYYDKRGGGLPWRVYPTPFDRRIIIEGGNIEEASRFVLYDIMGKEVYSGRLFTGHLSQKSGILEMPGVPRGVYYLQLMDQQGEVLVRRRILKQ